MAAGAVPGIEQGTTQAQQALLSVIAQQGAQGAQAFSAEQARQQQAHQDAVKQLSHSGAQTGPGAPSALISALNSQQGALQSVYDQDRAMSQGSYNNVFGGIRGANDAYFKQAAAAAPALRAQTEGMMAQERARLQAEREEREFQAQQRREQAVQDAADRAFAEEERAWQREQMAYDKEMLAGEKDEEKRIGYAKDVMAKAAETSMDFAEHLDVITSNQDNLPGALSVARQLYNQEVEAAKRHELETGEPAEPIATWEEYVTHVTSAYTGKDIADDKDMDSVADSLFQAGLDPKEFLPGYATREDRARRSAIEGARVSGSAKAYAARQSAERGARGSRSSSSGSSGSSTAANRRRSEAIRRATDEERRRRSSLVFGG